MSEVLKTILISGSGGVGFSARLDRFFTDELFGFVGYESAPESSDGTIEQTTAVFGGLAADFAEAMTIRRTVAYDSNPDRTTISIGMARRF